MVSLRDGSSVRIVEFLLPPLSGISHCDLVPYTPTLLILPQYYLLSTERLYINHLMQPIGLPLLTLSTWTTILILPGYSQDQCLEFCARPAGVFESTSRIPTGRNPSPILWTETWSRMVRTTLECSSKGARPKETRQRSWATKATPANYGWVQKGVLCWIASMNRRNSLSETVKMTWVERRSCWWSVTTPGSPGKTRNGALTRKTSVRALKDEPGPEDVTVLTRCRCLPDRIVIGAGAEESVEAKSVVERFSVWVDVRSCQDVTDAAAVFLS